MLQYNTGLLDRSRYYDRAGQMGRNLGSLLQKIPEHKKAVLKRQTFAGYQPGQDPYGKEYRQRQTKYYDQLTQSPRWADEGHQGLQQLQQYEMEQDRQKVADEYNKIRLNDAKLSFRAKKIDMDNEELQQFGEHLSFASQSPAHYQATFPFLAKEFPERVQELGLTGQWDENEQARITMFKPVAERRIALNAARKRELQADEDRALKQAKVLHDMEIAEGKLDTQKDQSALNWTKHRWDKKFSESKLALEKEKLDYSKKQADAQTKAQKAQSDKEMFGQADKLRDDFDKLTKEFRSITRSYSRVQATAGMKTATGDMSLIFAYMKMLDPESAVRESEQANARNVGSVPDRVWHLYNRTIKGHTFTPKIRQEFIGAAQAIYNGALSEYNNRVNEYTKRAERFGVDTDLVISDYTISGGKKSATETPEDFLRNW